MIKNRKHTIRRLHAVIKLLRPRSGNEELISRVLDDNINEIHIKIKNSGVENRKQIVYLISREDKNEGFFALLRTSLYYLAVADRFNFIPYVVWSSQCSYYEVGGYEGKSNPYEYFFKQIGGLTLESVMNSYNLVCSENKHIKVVSEFPLETPYYYNERFIDEMGRLAKKYIHFNESIEKRLEFDIHAVIKEKTLGVHYRGTDFKNNYDAHPKLIEPTDYFKEIDYAILRYGFEYIFVATDDKNALDIFSKKYGRKLIYYTDTLRSNANVSVMNKREDRENSNFLKGYEVLRDAFTLSILEGIISGVSMVSIFSRIFKKRDGQKYKIDIVIDHGVNKNSNKYITCK